MKKKLGLLATLAMCVTVGGVYATWNYGESSNTDLTVFQSAAVGLSGTATASSSLKIKDGSNSLAFKADDTTNDHMADALVSTGSITVVYESTAPVQYDINIYCNVTITATNGKEYFVTTLEKNALKHTYTMSNELMHEWTVNASDLKIDLGSDLKSLELATLQEYNEFAAELSTLVSISVHFTTAPIA